MDEQIKQPLYTLMVVGDSHLDSKNIGYHLNYPEETLFYEDIMKKLAEMEHVDYYVNAGDFTNKGDFSLDYRIRIDEILKTRKDIIESRGGEVIYLKGNHDITGKNTTEYDYYVSRNMFVAAANKKTLDLKNSAGEIVLHIEFRDYGDTSSITCAGKHNIIIAHGYFVFDNVLEGDDIPNYGNPVRLTDMDGWKGAEYLLCGHIHSEHIMRGQICGTSCTVHYLPCLSRPAYIKKLEEGPDAKREGSIDLIRVYEDDIELERVPIEFLDNKVCFNIERIHNDAAKLEQGMANKERREALMTMAEELEQYEQRETDPVKQVEQLGNVEQKYKDIVYDWFAEASKLQTKK